MTTPTSHKTYIDPYLNHILQIPTASRVAVVARAIHGRIEGEGQGYSRSITPFMTPKQVPVVAGEIGEFFRKTVLPTVPGARIVRFHLAVLHLDGSKSCNQYRIQLNN